MWGLSNIANTIAIDRHMDHVKGDMVWLILKWVSKGKSEMRPVSEQYEELAEYGKNASNESAEEIVDNLIAKYKKAE